MTFSSCSDDNEVADKPFSETFNTLHAQIPNSTTNSRVSIQDDGKATWSKGDAFVAFDEDGTKAVFTLEGNGGEPNGTFKTRGRVSAPNRAIFPAYSLPVLNNNIISMSLKAEYNTIENSREFPMVGSIIGDKVNFTHLTGILKIDLTDYTNKYTMVRIVTDKAITGDFKLDLSDTAKGIVATTDKNDTKNTISVYRKADESIFYVPMPASNYSFIKVYALNGKEDAAPKLLMYLMDKTIKRGAIHIEDEVSPSDDLTPLALLERVSVQTDSVMQSQVIDNNWAAVGVKRDYALQYDFENMFDDKPSYRFELKEGDNTLEGYSDGSKGRVEMSYSYATSNDFLRQPHINYAHKQITKTVYHHGKGSCKQGSKMKYTFSVLLPEDIDREVHTIFAQWHGMPSRTLVYDPNDGKVKQLTDEEFIALTEIMDFKKDVGVDKVTGKENGWLVEQGGYPPMAFGINSGYFYIQANSDKTWMTDKSERCNINPATANIGDVNSTKNKSSALAYKLPINDFPLGTWVTFEVNVDWSVYEKWNDNILKPGKLDIYMKHDDNGSTINNHIVNNQTYNIGRNDDEGYYFKFGIYRTSGSEVPLHYSLAGYKEEVR